MFGLTDKIVSMAAGAAALLLAAALAWQTYQLSSERSTHTALKLSVSQENERRTAAALGVEIKTAKAESTHASATQENSDAFTTSEPTRAAIARADAAIARDSAAAAERVRRTQAARAATYSAMAQDFAATASDSANRLIALDQQLTAGIALVAEGSAVVADLRKDLGRRDAEIVLLHGQIVADRALLAGGADQK